MHGVHVRGGQAGHPVGEHEDGRGEGLLARAGDDTGEAHLQPVGKGEDGDGGRELGDDGAHRGLRTCSTQNAMPSREWCPASTERAGM